MRMATLEQSPNHSHIRPAYVSAPTSRGTHYEEACEVLFMQDGFVMLVSKLENRQTRSEAPKAFRNPVLWKA